MTKFSNKLQKPCFWPILGTFSQFWGNFFLSRTTSYEFLVPCQISEKTNDTIPRKRLGKRTDRPYFIGPFWLPPGVQKALNIKMALISLPGPDRIVKLLTDTNPSKNKARKSKTFKFSINSFLHILAVFRNK